MSALPSQNIAHSARPTAESKAVAAEWLPLKVAAQRSGISIGHLARKCGETWAAAGLAKTMPIGGVGKPAWHVSVSAGPAFCAVKFPEHIPFDLRQLTEEQRTQLSQRKEIIDRWEVAIEGCAALGFSAAQVTAKLIQQLQCERGIYVCERTIRYWASAFRREGMRGLCDGRWLRGGEGDGASRPGEFLEYLKNCYLSPRRLSRKTCWELAMSKAAENGLRTIGYRASCLYLDKIPIPVGVKNRLGPDAFKTRCESYIQRDYTTLRSNEIWCADHHQLDVICQNPGAGFVRPWLSAFEDMRSRMIVGWCIYAHDPNSNSILSAMRGGILSHGIPELIYIDNGKDFGSYVFHGSTKWQRRKGTVQLESGRVAGILNHLQIKSRFAWAYHGQSKPIERFFNTIEARFSRGFNTYCGRHPLDKPECLQRQLELGNAPKLADFSERFGRWLDVYHNSAHRGQGMNGQSPRQIYDSSWNGFAKRTTSEDMLDLLLTRQTKEVVVHRNGVNYLGLNFGQYAPERIQWAGKKVYLRIDERDISKVSVWSPDDKFIGYWTANQRIPANATHGQLSSAIAEKRRHRKLVREYHQQRPRLAEDLPDLMIRAAARNQIQPAALPVAPDLKLVRSPIESELPKVRRGKNAAKGLESDGTPIKPVRFEYTPTRPSPDDDAEPLASDVMRAYYKKAGMG